MKTEKSVIEALKTHDQNAISKRERIIEDYIEGFDLNNACSNFAAILSHGYMTSNDDNGIFDSQFCYNIEKMVAATIRAHVELEARKTYEQNIK